MAFPSASAWAQQLEPLLGAGTYDVVESGPSNAGGRIAKAPAELALNVGAVRGWHRMQARLEQRAIEKRRVQEILSACGPDPSRQPAQDRLAAVRQRVLLKQAGAATCSAAAVGSEGADHNTPT